MASDRTTEDLARALEAAAEPRVIKEFNHGNLTVAAPNAALLRAAAARLRDLEAALEPFAKMARDMDVNPLSVPDHLALDIVSSYEAPVGNPTVGDLRRARALTGGGHD